MTHFGICCVIMPDHNGYNYIVFRLIVSGTRPVERGRLAPASKPHLDQSQPPVFFFGSGLTGLRSERMYRHVRVLHQPGPLRSRINQVDGAKPVFCSYETAQEH